MDILISNSSGVPLYEQIAGFMSCRSYLHLLAAIIISVGAYAAAVFIVKKKRGVV